MTRSNFIDKERSEWEIGLSLSLAFVVQDDVFRTIHDEESNICIEWLVRART